MVQTCNRPKAWEELNLSAHVRGDDMFGTSLYKLNLPVAILLLVIVLGTVSDREGSTGHITTNMGTDSPCHLMLPGEYQYHITVKKTIAAPPQPRWIWASTAMLWSCCGCGDGKLPPPTTTTREIQPLEAHCWEIRYRGVHPLKEAGHLFWIIF